MPDFDTSVPHIARVYDSVSRGPTLVLGGKDNVGGDIDAEQQTKMVRRLNESVATMRDRAGVTRLFAGLELIEPGVVRVADFAAVATP